MTIDVARCGNDASVPMKSADLASPATHDEDSATTAGLTLIGQYDSPFVRRVAVALQLLALPYKHLPWSVWADAEEIARYSPLRRVPVLVLEDGSVLVESFAILDALDDRVGEARALDLQAYKRLRKEVANGPTDPTTAPLVWRHGVVIHYGR